MINSIDNYAKLHVLHNEGVGMEHAATKNAASIRTTRFLAIKFRHTLSVFIMLKLTCDVLYI